MHRKIDYGEFADTLAAIRWAIVRQQKIPAHVPRP